MSTPPIQVVLHALAPDATDAGADYTDTTLEAVSEARLRKLLAALADLAPRLPATITFHPQIRIHLPAGAAMITPVEGRLYYGNWNTKGLGVEVSVEDIMAMVAGTAEPPAPAKHGGKSAAPMPSDTTGRRRRFTVPLLGLAIVVMNATTAWMLLKPAPTILPAHEFLPAATSDALLQQVAGSYQTGNREGDRHLEIEPLGLLQFSVYGPNRTLLQKRLQSGRGARTAEGKVIITSSYGVIRIVDPNTITVYGDTYHRIGS